MFEDYYMFALNEEAAVNDDDNDNDLLPIEDVIDFGKGRLTSANSQQSTWYH